MKGNAVAVFQIGNFTRSLCLLLVFVTELSFSQSGDTESDRCIQCHGNQKAIEPKTTGRAPLLAEQFSMDWSMFEFASKELPPFSKIPEPHLSLSGTTHYDWSRKAMTEIYHDKCIDIFPKGRDYRCQFTSINDKTYLIRHGRRGTDEATTCCLWNTTGFWAPRPDVLRNMAFQQAKKINGQAADWWILDIPLPGPFGYGIYRETAVPAAFWFPVISGWVQQNFKNFVAHQPDSKVFDLPAVCSEKTVKVCD